MLKSIRPKGRVIFAYLFIPVVLFIFTVFVPLISALYYGFTDWKGGPVKHFNGIQNYVQLLHDDVFWHSFGNNIFLVIACIIGQIGIAFIIVMLINSKLVKLKGIHRTFGFFPSTISALCIGFVWKMIYDQRTGLLNWFLVEVLHNYKNMKSAPIWLGGEAAPIMLVLSIPLIWQYIGYYMVIILSAVASIDTAVLESAEIDGATGIQRAMYVVFPADQEYPSGMHHPVYRRKYESIRFHLRNDRGRSRNLFDGYGTVRIQSVVQIIQPGIRLHDIRRYLCSVAGSDRRFPASSESFHDRQL